MKKVLFVCLGNICRSPMAEGIFKAIDQKDLHIESRATSSWEHGNPTHPGTLNILDNYSVDTSHMVSQQITRQDFYDFDYIIGMDNQNVKDLLRIAPKETKEKIHLYLDVLDSYKGKDIPDPWYTGNFEETQQLIELGKPYWLDRFNQK